MFTSSFFKPGFATIPPVRGFLTLAPQISFADTLEMTLLRYDVARAHTGRCYFRRSCGCNRRAISCHSLLWSQIAAGRRLTSPAGPSTLEQLRQCDPNFLHCSAYNLEARCCMPPKPADRTATRWFPGHSGLFGMEVRRQLLYN